ncbi:MAG: glycosyltransferase family 4 protein [Candidatus Omnitrophica bacterium]|nr:glycosyltransferase family 4 protein [Candidatus Omnitrophota bacterium]
MKILLAIDSATMGGAQNVFFSCVKELLVREHELVTVVSSGSLADLLKASKVNCYIVDYSSLKSLQSIFRILKREKVDVINTYLTRCSLLFALVNIFYRIPLCCTLLNAIIHEKMKRWQMYVYPFFYHLLHRFCDGIIVNSSQNKDHFVEVAKMRPNRVKVIYSGIDDKEVVGIPRQERSGKQFIIGTVGRLSPEKGQRYLVEALKCLKEIDYRCIVIGDGPLREELLGQVEASGLSEKVEFLGFRGDVLQLMQNMDIVVVPSVNETFGITIVEAFASKKIVIASTAGGIPELVKHGVTGFLFPVGDSLALSEEISYVFSNKDKTKEVIGEAYDFYRQNFTSTIMVDNTLNYYETIANKNVVIGDVS